MMKPESQTKIIRASWGMIVAGIGMLVMGMAFYFRTLIEFQNQSINLEPAIQPFVLAFILALFFTLGWRFPVYVVQRFSCPFNKGDIFLVLLTLSTCLIFFLVGIKPNNDLLPLVGVSCGLYFASGNAFGTYCIYLDVKRT